MFAQSWDMFCRTARFQLTFKFDDSEELAREMDRVLDRIAETLPDDGGAGETPETEE